MLNRPISELMQQGMQGMRDNGAISRAQQGMSQAPMVDMNAGRQPTNPMQFQDGMDSNMAQSIGDMFSQEEIDGAQDPAMEEMGGMESYAPPEEGRRSIKDLEPWEDKLDLFKDDRNSAIEEILRAKEIYEAEAEAYGKGFNQTKRGKQIAEWGKQVRKASGLTEREFSAAVDYSSMQSSLSGELGAQRRMIERT